jgi:hypothetical protein
MKKMKETILMLIAIFFMGGAGFLIYAAIRILNEIFK